VGNEKGRLGGGAVVSTCRKRMRTRKGAPLAAPHRAHAVHHVVGMDGGLSLFTLDDLMLALEDGVKVPTCGEEGVTPW
jgi:hypothetical protein